MSEWWTYRPQNLLMFAPDTYWRLFELHNAAAWPLPWVLPLLGAGWLWWWWRRPLGAALLVGLAGSALALVTVAWSFLWRLYAPINWAAEGFAWLFVGLSVGLLVMAALTARGFQPPTAAPLRRGTALALLAFAIGAHPLLAATAGRPWTQAEVIALAPDPTVIAVLGLLLASRSGSGWLQGSLRALLWCGALAWCAISSATLSTMGSGEGAVPALAGGLALSVCLFGRRPEAARSPPFRG
ncbi:MAG: hypothetical protein ABIN96_13385 [Rubrivivax sp.]